MNKYLLDTNIWIDISHNNGLCTQLRNWQSRSGCLFALAPPVLIELFRGVILGGSNGFQQNKSIFACSRELGCEILELPRPFITKFLGLGTTERSGVQPSHYQVLIEALLTSPDHDAFLRATNEPGGVWRHISRADEIHRDVLERELNSLQNLARKKHSVQLAARLSAILGPPGCRPKPFLIKERFSAALEFLEASITKIRSGANPLRNDPGIYVDFQTLLYLADPNIYFVTQENFSHEIRTSPQRPRIIHSEVLLAV